MCLHLGIKELLQIHWQGFELVNIELACRISTVPVYVVGGYRSALWVVLLCLAFHTYHTVFLAYDFCLKYLQPGLITANPCTTWWLGAPCLTWLPKRLTAVIPWYLWGIGARTALRPKETRILRCSSPLYKITWTMHTVRPPHLLLVQSMDVKPRDTEGQLHIYWKNPASKWTCAFQTHVVQGLIVLCHIQPFIIF